VIGSDGIWDCLSNAQCVQKLGDKINNLKSLDDTRSLSWPLEETFDEIIADSASGDHIGTDNMTGIIVYLNCN
jgi:serine/threonine protein phosphatase PrpC